MKTIVDYLEHWAARQPHKLLFSFLDVDGNERESFDWIGFRDRTRGLAAYLKGNAGLRRGERVLLVYPPGLEIIAAFFACVRAGVIPVPVYPPTPANLAGGLAKLAFIANDCEARAALTTREFREAAAFMLNAPEGEPLFPGMPALPPLDLVATDDLDGLARETWADDPGPVLFLQYTSGSTSDPKGVVVSHENLLHNAQGAVDHVPIAVTWLPQYHDMGLIGSYLFPVVSGGTTYGFEPLDFLKRPLLWLETITRVRATGSTSPNFGYEYCLREDKVPTSSLANLDLSSLHILANAAEPVRVDTCERFVARFSACGLKPGVVTAAYGLAENTLGVTYSGQRSVTVDKHLLQQGRLRVASERTPADNRTRLASCGRALAGVDVQIVNPASRMALGERQIGEIWVAGASTCEGYWNRPDLSAESFGLAIANDGARGNVYMRTGDLGFMQDEELFVCGRIKDLIIIRGVNYYPQDIEAVVQAASALIRKGGVAAFAVEDDGEALAVVAEVRSPSELPDPVQIARALRTLCYIEPRTLVFVPAGEVAKTTSGKIARGATRQRWLDDDLDVIATHRYVMEAPSIGPGAGGLRERFRYVLEPYRLTGNERCTFAEVGLDSITLVTLMEDVRALFAERGFDDLVDKVDLPFLQRVTVAEVFSVMEQCESLARQPVETLRIQLAIAGRQQETLERARMREDAKLAPLNLDATAPQGPLRNVLVTGVTGFFGPYLLERLLRTTSCTCHALVRAADPFHGMSRIRAALRRAGVWGHGMDELLRERVKVVCGDLAQPRLGIDEARWGALASGVDTVLHDAALVDYNLPYAALRSPNVESTRELLRLCASGVHKEFHFVSTTLVFGWALGTRWLESEGNEAMSSLDMGYGQSKCVAEQLVLAAQRQGLAARIYRAATISASAAGFGNRDDIVVRLLTFMISHGLEVEATIQASLIPADVAAHNLVAIIAARSGDCGTLHLTADHYYNMMDITRTIAREHGHTFTRYDIPGFVAEINRQCRKGEPLYPLLDFINRNHSKVARMQDKRYDNAAYREARARCGWALPEPTLAETVGYLMTYLRREGLVTAPAPVCE